MEADQRVGGEEQATEHEDAPTAGSPPACFDGLDHPRPPRPRGWPERYEDLGRIAGGGSSEIRRVRDLAMDRLVAMKILAWPHANDPTQVRRFRREATITAFLEHPGVIPVHDRGVLPDGRPWFTMKEVRGWTLTRSIARLHAGEQKSSKRRRRLHQLLGLFHRMCETVAYAHSRGLIHRDLKPGNLMVGRFGEALVMDWGIARVMREASISEPESGRIDGDPAATQVGEIFGTIQYMAPEQARGEADAVGPAADVYSLGLVLWEILLGEPALRGSRPFVWARACTGEVPRIDAERSPSGLRLPEELRDIVHRATRPRATDRYSDAQAMAASLGRWIDGEARRGRARRTVAAARALRPALDDARARLSSLELEVRAARAALRPFDDEARKQPVWRLEDELVQRRREVARLDAERLEILRAALQDDPELDDAHELLAGIYHQRVVQAEEAEQADDIERWTRLLSLHDRAGRFDDVTRGLGRVSIASEPDAEAHLARYRELDRRLRLEPFGEPLRTPLVDLELPAGSYVLTLSAPDHASVRVPFRIRRGQRWENRRPDDGAVVPLRLPSADAIAPDEVYVPGGVFVAGGDARALEPVPRGPVWVGSFVISRFPVTNREYLAFLNALLADGREADAERHAPRFPSGAAPEDIEVPAFGRDAEGRFVLRPDELGRVQRLDWPVALVSFYDALAYAQWVTQRTGLPWRLPDELEWEKAARGVDERLFPWGAQPEATWACMLGTTAGVPSRAPVDAYPLDESPYGVRGVAGNVRCWCQNEWRADGPRVIGGVLQLERARGDELRAIRGGGWTAPPDLARLAGRHAARPDARFSVVGIRLARSIG